MKANVFGGIGKVVVRPYSQSDRVAFREALKRSLPGVRMRTTVAGVELDAWDTPRLKVDSGTLELRWDALSQRIVENRMRFLADSPRVFRELRNFARKKSATSLHSRGQALFTLDDHQIANVARMTLPHGFGLCVFDEQGTGKTITAAAAFDALVANDEVDFALIVAPKSMVPEWAEDLRRFLPGLHGVAVATGSRRDKTRAIRRAGDVLITNYETAHSLEEHLIARIEQNAGRCILIVDESYNVKNPAAQRTRALTRVREYCSRAFVLCGTPAPNCPDDILHQVQLVDFGYTFRNLGGESPDGARVNAIRSALSASNLAVRSRKSEVLPELPERRITRLALPLRPVQARLYASALDRLILDLKSTDEKTFARKIRSFMAQRSALLQICSNPSSLVDGYQETPAKLLALDSLLDTLIRKRGEKVVVWSFYRSSIEAIESRFKHFGLVRYDGAVTNVTMRRDMVRAFQSDPSVSIFLGNPAAAGAGLTLHAARIAIFESFSPQAAHFAQSLDRIHRRGQERSVESIMMLTQGTLEESEYESLIAKGETQADLLSDPPKVQVTRESMLTELTASNFSQLPKFSIAES